MVSGVGGSDLPAFQTALALPPYPPISITTDLAPGSVFPRNRNFTVQWSGGRAGDTVHMQISRDGLPGGYCDCAAPATTGSITLPTVTTPGFSHVTMLPSPGGPSEVRIFIESEGDQIQNFPLPGLTQIAQHRWLYEWRFGKITFP